MYNIYTLSFILLSIYDATSNPLYSNQYNLNWNNTNHWNIITSNPTITACNIPIQTFPQSLCIHTKSTGGFILKFTDKTNNIQFDFFTNTDWNKINTIYHSKSNTISSYTSHRRLYNSQYSQYFGPFSLSMLKMGNADGTYGEREPDYRRWYYSDRDRKRYVGNHFGGRGGFGGRKHIFKQQNAHMDPIVHMAKKLAVMDYRTRNGLHPAEKMMMRQKYFPMIMQLMKYSAQINMNNEYNNYYDDDFDPFPLQQQSGTPASLATIQSQQNIAQQLAKVNAQQKLVEKSGLGTPGKTGYKYLGPFGPRLGKREGLIPTMMRHMDQMAANMHAVANHLHRINTGNIHGFGPVPLNRKERNVLRPTLKAYMNGSPVPASKKDDTRRRLVNKQQTCVMCLNAPGNSDRFGEHIGFLKVDIEKCVGLENGLEICVKYGVSTNELNVNIKNKKLKQMSIAETDSRGVYFDTLIFNWNDMNSMNDLSLVQIGDKVLSIEIGEKCVNKWSLANFKLCVSVNNIDITMFFKRIDNGDDIIDILDVLKIDKSLKKQMESELKMGLFNFNNDNDWDEIIISNPILYNIGKESEANIELFGRKYRLKESDILDLGQPIKLAKTAQMSVIKMCRLMGIVVEVCMEFDPNVMDLKLSMQFASEYKEFDLNQR